LSSLSIIISFSTSLPFSRLTSPALSVRSTPFKIFCPVAVMTASRPLISRSGGDDDDDAKTVTEDERPRHGIVRSCCLGGRAAAVLLLFVRVLNMFERRHRKR